VYSGYNVSIINVRYERMNIADVGRCTLLYIKQQRPDSETVGHATPVISAGTTGQSHRSVHGFIATFV